MGKLGFLCLLAFLTGCASQDNPSNCTGQASCFDANKYQMMRDALYYRAADPPVLRPEVR